jgi:hypothetical protein
MTRSILLLSIITLLTACSKNDPPAPATKTVRYVCNCTPLLGATLTGTITYTTPTSATNTASFTNNSWTFTQSGWNLKSGDRLTASASILGNSNCTLSLYVDDVLKTFRNEVIQISGQNPTNSLQVEYLVP